MVPYTRVNHNKYMVTDNGAYIGSYPLIVIPVLSCSDSLGTSNWSGDYFVSTGGVSCIVNQTTANDINSTVQEQLLAIFDRDWYSDYSIPVNNT